MSIEPGKPVLVRNARGERLPKVAVTGVVQGGTMLVVWVADEHEFAASRTEGREPEAVPWPADAVEQPGSIIRGSIA